MRPFLLLCLCTPLAARAQAGPEARDDAFSVDQRGGLLNVRANDTGLGLFVIDGFTAPEHGSLERINRAQDLFYTPQPGFVGVDRFTYTLFDGTGGTSTAGVVVHVIATPTIDAVDDRITITQDSGPVSLDVLANDIPGANPLFAYADTAEIGTVEPAPDGLSLIYTPPPGFLGITTFVYSAYDAREDSDLAFVTVEVVPAPEEHCDPNALADLHVPGLSPAFAPGVFTYGMPDPPSDSVLVTPTACDANVAVYVNSGLVRAGQTVGSWVGDGRPVNIVLYRNWNEIARYTLTIDPRLAPALPPPVVASITAPGLEDFDPTVSDYDVAAPRGESLPITVTLENPNLNLYIQSVRVENGRLHNAWAPLGQSIDIVVYDGWTEVGRYYLHLVEVGRVANPPVRPGSQVCLAPSLASCNSPSWWYTTCGRQEEIRLANGNMPTCGALCAADPPGAAECLDDGWLSSACGRIETPRLLAAIGRAKGVAVDDAIADASLCFALVEDADTGAIETVGLSPKALEVAPGETPVVEPDAIRSVTLAQYARKGQYYTGGNTQYLSHRLREWTRSSSGAPGGGIEAALSAVQDAAYRAAWNANGVEVESCREYVYEKYYDYSLFENAIQSKGADWRAVFDIAYDLEPNPPADPDGVGGGPEPDSQFGVPRKAIGRRGVLGITLKARDNKPLPRAIVFPTGAQPKNPFFALPALDDEDRQWILDHPAPPFDPSPDMQGSCGYNLATPVFCDDDLHQRLQDAQAHTFVETWAWHEDKAEALAGYHDEELYTYERVVAAYEEVMYRRELQAGRIVAYWKAIQDKVEDAAPDDVQQAIFDPSIYMHSGIQETLRQQRSVAVTRTVLAHPELIGGLIGGLGGLGGGVMFGGGPGGGFGGGQVPNGPALPPIEPPLSGGPSGLEYLRQLQDGLMALDAEVEQALLDARDLGCLELTPDNPCDWSPRRFGQRVNDLYVAEREADFLHCQENTPDGFEALEGEDMGIPDDGVRVYPTILPELDADEVECFVNAAHVLGAEPVLNCAGCNDWNHGSWLVDQYFKCIEARKGVILEVVQSEVGPEVLGADNKLKLQGSSAELHKLGNSDFNVKLAYGFGWSLGEFEGFVDDEEANHCHLKPEGYGHFDIDATALGMKQSLVHASAHARLGDGAGGELPIPDSVTPNRIEVQILDQDLFDPIATVVDNQFNVVQDQWEEGGTLIQAQATFTIVVVPVTIKGGVAGKIGVTYAIEGEIPLEPQEGNCDLIHFTGSFSPYAQVDGFASVSIDAVIAEAGIRIDLTLVRLDLPFDVTVAIGIFEGFDLGLRIETNLDLVISLLSGELSVYFRILWEEFKGTIFKWDGPRWEINLLNTQLEVPLLPLRDLALSLPE